MEVFNKRLIQIAAPRKLLALAGILLLLAFTVSKWVEFPDEVLSILSVGYIFYVPFGIGTFILGTARLSKIFREYFVSIEFSSAVIAWIIGAIIITIIVFAFSFYGKSIMSLIGPAFLGVSIISPFLVSVSRPKNTFPIKIVMSGFFIGLSFGLYVHLISPYPLTPGMDIFTHIYTAKNVLNGTVAFSPVIYIPTADTLIALGTQTYNADFPGVFWIGSIFLFALFGISVFALIFWLSKSSACAIIGTVIALGVTEMGKVPNLQFFYPSGFLMSIYPLVLIASESVWDKVKNIPTTIIACGLTAILLVGLIMMHLQIGVVASIIILLYLAVRYAVNRSNLALSGIRIATITLAIIVIFLYLGISTVQLEYFPVVDRLLFQYQQSGDVPLKIRDLNEWYTPVVITISLAGLIILSLFEDNKRALVISFIGSFVLWIYFQEIGHIGRIMILDRPILAFAAATVILLPIYVISRLTIFRAESRLSPFKSVMKTIRRPMVRSFGEYLQRPRKLTVVYLIIILILLFPVIMLPYDTYFDIYFGRGFDFVNFTQEEINAGKWIEKNTHEKALVYSDPITVLEMRGLGFRKNVEGISWNSTVANEVKLALETEKAIEAYKNIVSNAGKNVLIVVSPRTAEWIAQNPENLTETSDINKFYIQWPVTEFKLFEGLIKFFDTKYFELLYGNIQNDIYIFKPV